MKNTKKVVSVHVNDGTALYINGKKVSNWYTYGESRIVEALGFEVTEIVADSRYYRNRPFPELLCHVKKQSTKK